MIIVIDAEGTIQYESPSTQNVLGYTIGSREGANGFHFIHPDDVERVREARDRKDFRGP